MKRPLPSPSRPGREHGIAATVMLVIMLVTSLYFVLGQFSETEAKRKADAQTTRALALAKDALLGFAARNDTRPGSLPCPDQANDGRAASSVACNTNGIAKLPWRTLGLGDLRDGAGECLWYSLAPSSIYRNTQSSALNPNSGTTLLTLRDGSGVNISTEVVAIIVAPGPALPSQNRTPAAAGHACSGTTTPLTDAVNYLDTGPAPGNIHNYQGGTSGVFVAAAESGSFNDRVITITREELFAAVARRLALDLKGHDNGGSSGLLGYLKVHHHLPCAANAGSGGMEVASLTSGFFPLNTVDMTLSSSAFQGNNYRSITGYTVSPNCTTSSSGTVGIFVPGQSPVTFQVP